MVTVKLRTPMSLLLGRDGILEVQEGELLRITSVLSPDDVPQASVQFNGEFQTTELFIDSEDEIHGGLVVTLEGDVFRELLQIGLRDHLDFRILKVSQGSLPILWAG